MPLIMSRRGGIGNDRMEFIGDAVIDLAVADMLYELHPERDEGWLTQMRSRLVDEGMPGIKARELNSVIYNSWKGEAEGGRFGRNRPSCPGPMRH